MTDRPLVAKSITTVHEVFDPDDDDIDVEVVLEDDTRWGATFYTLRRVEAIMELDRTRGESANGSYFAASSPIFVRRLDLETFEATVHDLLERGHFTTAFEHFKPFDDRTLDDD